MGERRESVLNGGEGYSLRVRDESMSPAFEPGWFVYADPMEILKPGDDVVVVFKDNFVVVRRFVRRTSGEVTLRQFNPPREFDVASSAVRSVHYIAGTWRRR